MKMGADGVIICKPSDTKGFPQSPELGEPWNAPFFLAPRRN